MINRDIARIFNEIADFLELKNENPFRVRAYRKAAQTVEVFPKDLADLSIEELQKIPGVGKDLALKIREYADTNTCKAWTDLKAEFPDGILELLTIPGLGPRTARLLFDELKISGIEDLDRAAREGRLKGLPHIKAKAEQNILKGLEAIRKGGSRLPIGKVLPMAEEIVRQLGERAPVGQVSVAGSIRRWRDTIRDIDLLATSADPRKVMDIFTSLPMVERILAKGPTKSSIVLSVGVQVDLRVVEEDSYGAALLYFTGSKAHNIKVRQLAVRKGLTINEYGIFEEATMKSLAGREENEIYKIVGMPYIEPELREDAGEVEAALAGHLPQLISLEDIKGDLHVHSEWTDGRLSIEEAAAEARKRGLEYIAITDHAKGPGRGLNETTIPDQIREIEALNKKLRNFKILTGTEVNIRSDNTLDLPDEILKKLDVVVASVHQGFKQTKEQITGRIKAAMLNPYVSIIGHPTGRIIGQREPYEIDMPEVLRAAKETGTVLEINAHPSRLDLNDVNAREADRMGVPISINTDMHVPREYDFLRYGVAVARRGWLSKTSVINTLGLKELREFLKKKRMK